MPVLNFKTKVEPSAVLSLVPLSMSVSSEYVIFPGFCDVHVHFREPGFSYKETVFTGSMAAAHGGFTDVCTMPNLSPPPDSADSLAVQREIIRQSARVKVHPYGCITRGRQGKELSDMEAMADKVIAFSDDGSGVQNDELMEAAMRKAKSLGKLIAAHCEDERRLHGGCIHEGEYAARHGFVGISSESEYAQIKRDLELVRKTGCAYHVCHISAKESVELIRAAKKSGLDVSCETAPHYLLMDDSMLRDEGRFKMNPPLRGERDREALVEGLLDGTIDMIATDHAPHSAEEKSKGLKGSAFGIVGLETAFPLLYTGLVKEGIISLDKLIELMAIRPRERFCIPDCGDYTLWDLNAAETVEPESFLSKGKSTPFAGERIYGRCLATVCGGNSIYTRR